MTTSTRALAPSAVQHGMLFHHLKAPDSGVDVEQMVCTLKAPLDHARFHEAWQRAVQHHPALRSAFAYAEGAPRLLVADQVDVPLREVDLAALAPAAQAEAIDAYLRADRRQGFRFDEAPLLRLALFRLSGSAVRLVWTFSHAIVDGNVFADLLREVFDAYAALVRGEQPQFPARPDYADYLDWLELELPARRGAALAHFRGLLAGFLAPTPLPRPHPTDASLAAAGDATWAEHALSLSRATTDALRALGEAERLPLSSFVQAAWAQTLAAHSGESDVVFGVTRACRRSSVPGAERMVGLFINTLPLRAQLDPAQPLLAFVHALRAEHTAQRPYEHTPLVDVQSASDVRGAPLFGSIIVYNEAEVRSQLRRGLAPDQAPHVPSDVRFIEQTNFELTLFAYAEPELLLKLTYDPRKYDAPTVARVLALVRDVLDAMAAQPGATLAALPRASAEEAARIRAWNHTAVPVEPACIHALFEAQVARTPDATALVYRDRTLSYRELDARANRLAQGLRAQGVGPEVLVGLCVERSLELVVGLLGILKAGGAYVPLDPVYPRQRLAMMLEDARAPVLVTQRKLVTGLPAYGGAVVCIDELDHAAPSAPVHSGVTPDQLAYVIFTSGSTGRPKGVMVQHKNAANFFAGMDRVLGHDQPGVWLAVTSISFDISVLELFWTLSRGFRVVLQEESDRASLAKHAGATRASATPMGFGLFYFAADTGAAPEGAMYRQLLEGAKFADRHGFTAVWTPERHFHAFGGLYPNPVVTTAALATITQHVQLRAGSVVLPLHNPLRVAEDWAVVDHLSNGRIGLSFATGWHINDFAFFPDNYKERQALTLAHIATVEALWRGEKVKAKNGAGEDIEVSTLPRPLQAKPPMWLAAATNPETFKTAGRIGANVLTNMLGQDIGELSSKIAAYRAARREAGHAGEGIVSVMLHTFVCDDDERARELARKPFCNYLASSFDLVKVAPWMFPAFRQPSRAAADDTAYDPAHFTDEDMAALLEHAFDRYFDTAGLFGTPERALAIVEKLKAAGANEVACLIDFGIDPDVVLASLPELDRLRQLANPAPEVEEVNPAPSAEAHYGIAEQLQRHQVTHFQCTPSMARMLLNDAQALPGLRGLRNLLLGGEALPADLVDQLAPELTGTLLNMYGPTETTVWSTSAAIDLGTRRIHIGTPIANTEVRITQAGQALAPIGAPGELCIGGHGVVRGYLHRPDLTAERFVPHPDAPAERLYRTGDLARLSHDGTLEFIARIDHQVKVNGYRIELGEIETLLSRHPGVRQSVVLARSDDGAPAQLVAYVVPGTPLDTATAAGAGAHGERVAAWQKLWDETYKNAPSAPDQAVRFNHAGWNSSYTGEPIPAAEMREWLDHTVSRIVALGPRRVLELGCGTGMILYGVTPHVAHYTGIDLSAHALHTIAQQLTADEHAKVTLRELPAHALAELPEGPVDTVVINSVAQYFPDADYLVEVLRAAVARVDDGGRIFVGDVRSRDHLTAFHTLVTLHHAAPEAERAELAAQVARRIEQESELTLSEGFFHALARELPRIARVEVQLKDARAENELSCFRYDVILHVGPRSAASSAAEVVELAAPEALAGLRDALAAEPTALFVAGVRNRRLVRIAELSRALGGTGSARADAYLRELAAPGEAGLDPSELYALDPRYEVELRFAHDGDPYRFDALFRHRRSGLGQAFPRTPEQRGAPASYAKQPAKAEATDSLVSALRTHLKELLPEYMLPAAYVVLPAFPTTPNGKTDRAALPAPERAARRAAAAYTAPESAIEQAIAGIWQDMLGLTRVGRHDNIFELGANSLLTVQANNRLSAALGKKVSLVSMFRFPTVQSLAAHLGDDGKPAPEAAKRVLEREDRKKDAAERRRQARAERGL